VITFTPIDARPGGSYDHRSTGDDRAGVGHVAWDAHGRRPGCDGTDHHGSVARRLAGDDERCHAAGRT